MDHITRQEPGGAVLILDFDGVVSWCDPDHRLSARERLRPAAVARLDLIVQRTGALVIVSSAWRKTLTVRELGTVLATRGFRGVVSDVTPVREQEERWCEIQTWLDAQDPPPRSLAILEDSEPMGPLAPWLVRIDYESGLLDEHVEDAVRLLNEPMWARHADRFP